MPDCPICKNAKSVRQAHKKHLDYILRFLQVFAYRCESCSTRFYRGGRPKEAAQDQSVQREVV